MHQPNLSRPLLHRRDKTNQPRLIGMRLVPANAMHTCANVIALSIEFHVTVARTETLNGMAWRASGLVADKQHVVPWVAQHGL